jgi:hypothetical protein
MPKTPGFAKDPRFRRKQEKMLEVYAEQAGTIGGDPERDRAAKIAAVERAGYTRAASDGAKLRQFMQLWKSDEARAYLCQLWGLAIEEEKDGDPVALAMRLLHTHAVQTDESWGPRDRMASLSATREMVRLFIPAQTAKVATLNLSAKVERPAQFDTEPVMQARAILPAGQTIAAPTGPTGADDDDEEEDDDD